MTKTSIELYLFVPFLMLFQGHFGVRKVKLHIVFGFFLVAGHKRGETEVKIITAPSFHDTLYSHSRKRHR